MDLNTRSQGNVLVIECNVESIDAANVRQFRSMMQSVLEGHKNAVLDMSRVAFVDSSGLGALIACLRELSVRKGDFRLAGMNRAVRALFELMRMHKVFGIHDTVEGAIASFA